MEKKEEEKLHWFRRFNSTTIGVALALFFVLGLIFQADIAIAAAFIVGAIDVTINLFRFGKPIDRWIHK